MSEGLTERLEGDREASSSRDRCAGGLPKSTGGALVGAGDCGAAFFVGRMGACKGGALEMSEAGALAQGSTGSASMAGTSSAEGYGLWRVREFSEADLRTKLEKLGNRLSPLLYRLGSLIK